MANNPATAEISGYGTFTINGINTSRGANQLIAFSTPAGGATGTNAFGYELACNGGVVTAKGANTNIPSGGSGFVLSGHGTVADAFVPVPVGTAVVLKDSGGAVTTWPAAGTTHSATGSLPSTVNRTGSATRERTASGSLGETVTLTGASSRDRTATGSLPSTVNRTGSATREANGSGSLDLVAALDGSTVLARDASGGLAVLVGIDGAAIREQLATGALAEVVTLTGSASGGADAVGGLVVTVGLDGTLTAVRIAAGDLVESAGLSGTASLERTLTGGLPVAVGLTGSASVSGQNAGAVALVSRPDRRLAGPTRIDREPTIVRRLP